MTIMIRGRGPLLILALLLLATGCRRGAGAPPEVPASPRAGASFAAGPAGEASAAAGGEDSEEDSREEVLRSGGRDADRRAVLLLSRALGHADPASETYDPPRAVEELDEVIATSPDSASANYAVVIRALLTHLASQEASDAEARRDVDRLRTRAAAAEEALGTCQRGLERIKAIILEGPSAGR